jgi:hypothetical protein
MRELPRGGPSARNALEAGDCFFFRVALEHGQQLRDGQQILNSLRQVQQLELAPLTADGCVGPDDFAEARAVDVGHTLEIEEQLLAVLLDQRVDLVLEQLVAFAERHFALQVENRHSVDDSFVDLHRNRLQPY